MNDRRATWLVISRELREAMRRRSFWIIIGIALVGSTAAVLLPEVLGGQETTYTVAVSGGDADLKASLEQLGPALDAEVRVKTVDANAAPNGVSDGTYTVAVQPGPPVVVQAKAGSNEQLVAAVQQVLALDALHDRLVASGMTDAQADASLAPPNIHVVKLKADEASRRGTAAIIAIILYIVLLMLTMQVANGVAIEKANRISEVLLAIVRPVPLLFGKVLAVGFIGLLTLVAGALPVLIKLSLGGSLPAGLPAALAAGAAWFVLGALLYLTIAGSLGALVERQEEAGAAVAPLSILLIGSYLVGQTASDTTLGKVLAILPLTSTMVMPSRIAIGAATAPEIILSLVLAIIAVLIALRVGATIYRRAIVRTGRRLHVREVLRSA